MLNIQQFPNSGPLTVITAQPKSLPPTATVALFPTRSAAPQGGATTPQRPRRDKGSTPRRHHHQPWQIPRPPSMPPAATRSSSIGGTDIEFALDLEDIAARAAKADCIGALACGRASFSYHRLPEPPLRLTVRKLDDSYFDVRISRSGAVWELKAAIQGVFVALYHDMENAVTWQHVWSHFCLCFKDEKMTDDKATLRAFGIKDGDELHFAQHLSVDYSPCKRSKSQRATSHRRSRTSVEDSSVRPRRLMDDLIEEDEREKKLIATRHSTSILDEDFCIYEHHEEHVDEDRKKGSSARGWFSYSRLRGNRRTHSENIVQPSCEKGTRPKLGKWLSSKMTKAWSK